MRWFAIIVLVAACKRVDSNAGPPTAERLAKACIRYIACDPFADSVGACIRDAHDATSTVSVYRPGQVRCLAETLGDCAQVAACLGISIGTCQGASTRCDGDSAVICSSGIEYSVDCGEAPMSVDGTCIDDSCGYRTCTNPNTSSCHGTRLERCEFDGIVRGEDCALYGERCVDDGGFARCEPTSALPCSGVFCDGEVLVECDFVAHRRDCASLYAGGKCSERALRCGYGDECSADAPSFCIGDSVEVCVLGKALAFDCTTLGFSRCANGSCVP